MADTQIMIKEKTDAILRTELDLYRPDGDQLLRENLPPLSFIRIDGITDYARKSEAASKTPMADILSGMAGHGASAALLLTGSESGIRLYMGTREDPGILEASLLALYPGIRMHREENNPLATAPSAFAGMLTGLPGAGADHVLTGERLSSVIRAMSGRRFSLLISAVALHAAYSTEALHALHEEMGRIYTAISFHFSGGVQGNQNGEAKDFHRQAYYDALTGLETLMKAGQRRGLWRVCTYFGADTERDAQYAGHVLRSSFSGETQETEPVRMIMHPGASLMLRGGCMTANEAATADRHPLGRFTMTNGAVCPLYICRFQTIMSSDHLGLMMALPENENPGYCVEPYVRFDTAVRAGIGDKGPSVPLGMITEALHDDKSGIRNVYAIPRDDLTRHAAIFGVTGGGKSNTARLLLHMLWGKGRGEERIPFLVIESAKREYWQLARMQGFEELRVFTLGGEGQGCVPYRINPFEVTPGISLQTHIDYLLSTFEAAFELYPPMPYALESAVYEVYSDLGWDITTGTNRYGLTIYPTLTDLYQKIGVVVRRMGYHKEVQSNVQAALEARIHSLMIGGKGAMMDVQRSVPISALLDAPCVMELEDIGDDNTKAFVIGLLMVQLYEYRKSRGETADALKHILLVEEAHRLLENVSSTGEGASSRAKAVAFFCNMLSEIRAYGQGLVIADQSPTKLAADVIRNTNLKIVHRTVERTDRETIGGAMNMTPDQVEALSLLGRGYAAVYAEGDSRPKCLHFPKMQATIPADRAEILARGRLQMERDGWLMARLPAEHAGCRYCPGPSHRCGMIREALEKTVSAEKVLEKWVARNYRPRSLADFLKSSMVEAMQIEGAAEKCCVIGYILEHADLTAGEKQCILASFREFLEEQSI